MVVFGEIRAGAGVTFDSLVFGGIGNWRGKFSPLMIYVFSIEINEHNWFIIVGEQLRPTELELN